MEVKRGAGKLDGIHADSPAGLFIKKNIRIIFLNSISVLKILIRDAGASVPQRRNFFLCMHLWLHKEAPQQDMEKLVDFKHLLEAYYEVAWGGQGQRPSGADLVGQFKGSLTFFDKNQGLISVKIGRSRIWIFLLSILAIKWRLTSI